MSTNLVNLDALIPRKDFNIDDQPTSVAAGTEKIHINELDGPFFGPTLRKPDFQRETNRWSPSKVVDLVRAFVDGDLIPAVILWKAGNYTFVIDGAHRLAALLAWIFDDYGDEKRSLDFFGGLIPEEQRRAAIKTRTLVQKEVGKYSDYRDRFSSQASAPEKAQRRLANLGNVYLMAQWVPRTDKKSAEDSFFKINLAATPIDPTESRILKSRRSASAIAARAITNGGRGHKYWADFDGATQRRIEEISGRIYHALYDPPLRTSAITTLDVPVAGHGYNVLAFAFDLVNEANGLDATDTATKRNVRDKFQPDPDGRETVSYLEVVEKRIERITTDKPCSLGVHPVVYFYTRGGAFQPSALLATSRFLEGLDSRDQLRDFIRIREHFEAFLLNHKEALGLIVHKFGSGGRHIPWLRVYYDRIADGLRAGKSDEEIWKSLGDSTEFSMLAAPPDGRIRQPQKQGRGARFSDATKTAGFWNAALPGALRCHLCHSLIHTKSVHTDHIQRKREEGSNDMRNAHPAHPYCNSIKG